MVNLPTCPVNPEWIVAMVVQLLLVADRDPATFLAKTPMVTRTVDDKVTNAKVDLLFPEGIFGQTIHDNCPRRGHFENGEFVTKLGSAEEAKGYCLYKVGCKGPQTYTNCPIVRWNSRASWCVESGAPCIGCGGLNWVDNNAPFLMLCPTCSSAGRSATCSPVPWLPRSVASLLPRLSLTVSA